METDSNIRFFHSLSVTCDTRRPSVLPIVPVPLYTPYSRPSIFTRVGSTPSNCHTHRVAGCALSGRVLVAAGCQARPT